MLPPAFGRRSPRPCQYGVFDVRCSAPATTKRQRPAGGETWDVCQFHADSLDRMRTIVAAQDGLLEGRPEHPGSRRLLEP